MSIDVSDGAVPAVRYERAGDVALVTLDRPGRLNAVNDALVNDLCASLARAGDEDAAAVVLTGAGRAFCAGHDLKQAPDKHVDTSVMLRLERLSEVTRRIRDLPVPVIAAVRGYALGAGCEFALCCDLVVAEPGAVFGFPEVEVGLAITGGMTKLLPMMVGARKASELVLLGRRLGATEAAGLGLVNAVVPEPVELAVSWANELAAKPRLALALAKSCLAHGPTADLETAFALETGASVSLINTQDALSAAEAFQGRAHHSVQQD